jgi:predicted transcriptional regulator
MLPLPDVVRQVRRARLTLGLTQSDLAQASGTSQSLVAKLEKGRLNPSYEVVRRLLEALDKTAAKDDKTAEDLMHGDPIHAEPAEPLGKALARMKEHGFSQLPVVDRGQPVGSISESAILERIEQGADLDSLKRQPVRFSMRASFPTVAAETRKRTLVELLRDHEAVLVVREGRMVGLVTKSDLW